MFEKIPIPILSEVRTPTPEIGFVAGGPCICFAKGQPERLTLQDLIDCLIPARVANFLNLPLRLYFQSYEDLLMSSVLENGRFSSDHNGIKNALNNGLNVVLAALDEPIPHITYLDTNALNIKAAIDRTTENLRDAYDLDQLYGLYQDGSTYPQGTPEENVLVEVYKRNISLYTRRFFIEIDGISQPFLLVENTGQCKAIELACAMDGVPGTGYFAYHPALNRQGKQMNLGNRNHKISLRSTEQQVFERSVPLMAPGSTSFHYYTSIFKNLKIVDIMALWRNSL